MFLSLRLPSEVNAASSVLLLERPFKSPRIQLELWSLVNLFSKFSCTNMPK